MNSTIRHISLWLIGALSLLHASSVFAQQSFNLTSTTLTVAEGGQVTFGFHPTPRPSNNMRATVSVSPSSGLTIDTHPRPLYVNSTYDYDGQTPNNNVAESQGTINFKRWGAEYAQNQHRTVTLTAAQDDDAIDNTFTITVTGAAGPKNESNTHANVTATITVTVTEDRSEGITPSTAAVNITEGGATGSFTVELDTAPTGNAVLSVTSQDAGALTVSPATLTFDASNYDTPQTVTVAAPDDADHDDESVSVTISATSGYDTAADATKTITVTDDDSIVVSTSSVSITEGGSAGTFGVKLNSAPSANTTIDLLSGDAGAVTLSPNMLTFTTSDYATEQQVTLTAVQDDDAQPEDVTITLSVRSGSGYSSENETVTVSVADDEDETIIVSPTTVEIEEGVSAGATFTVTLEAEPVSGDVNLSLTSGDPAAVMVSPSTLTFTAANYDMPQTVSVTPVDDDNPVHEIVPVTLAVTNSSAYSAPGATVTVEVKDDEAAPRGTIILSGPDRFNLSEGGGTDTGTGSFTVKIDDITTDSNITVSVVSDDPGAVSVSPATLIFPHDDFTTPQPVTVTAEDDADALHESVSIVVSGSNGITALRLAKQVTVHDDDTPTGTIVLDSADPLDIAAGGSAHFTVRLSSQPNARVSLSLSESDDAITLDPTSLTFSTRDWIEPQRVKVSVAPNTGRDNAVHTITLSASGGIEAPDAEKSVRPIYTPPPTAKTILVFPDETLRIDEGSSGSFSVGLAYPDGESPPSENVVVRLSNVNPDITLTPDALTFTPTTLVNQSAAWARWDETITVQVDALADSDLQQDTDIILLSADGFIVQHALVEIKDTSGSDWPMKAWALALPPPTTQDDAILRVGCKQDTPCFVYLDCNAQSDDSTSYRGVIPDAIPARGSTTYTALDIARHTGGGSWEGRGRLACALRSAGTISAQVWTRSGNGVLVNNSAMIRSTPEGERHRADIESISSPDSPDKANIRIHCIAPVDDCTDTRLSCYDDHGTMYEVELGRIRSQIVRHLQSEELAMRILHRWRDLALSCEVRSDRPFTVQVLSRTGGGGALVNNSATGN
ncbi:COG1470 family protein [Thioalkalivibrio sp. HK1]|uniref:COG1470 family protein n=1 Tax=Thioalkalivibrio sp. HK1 TaxID=1469245 RepID=UPI0004AD3E02|nr:hypothetical protein [Thioalkalivibrio sp. HK1]